MRPQKAEERSVSTNGRPQGKFGGYAKVSLRRLEKGQLSPMGALKANSQVMQRSQTTLGSYAKVSVIIPVYNNDLFVEQAVLSALAQPETGEVIIIEDNSKDNSLKVCRRLEKVYERVRVIQHEDKKNHGPGESRNLGIKHAAFKYISFLDSDDYYLNNRFKNDVKILENRRDIDGVYNAMAYHNDLSAGKNRKLTTITCALDPDTLFENMAPIGKKGYFAMGTLTVRKTIFDKTGLFDCSLKRSQDTHMFIKMAAAGRLLPGHIDKPVAVRRVQEKEKAGKRELMLSLRPLMFKKLFNWANEKGISTSRRVILWDNYCYYKFIKNNSNGKRSAFRALICVTKDALKYPFLLKHKNFYSIYLHLLAIAKKQIKKGKITKF